MQDKPLILLDEAALALARTGGSGLRLFSLNTLPSEPWRNGGGVTRTVATQVGGGAGNWLWRVSAADIGQDGPFSSFPGVDRTLALIDGRGLALRGESGVMRLQQPGECVRFTGEERVSAALEQGPLRVWNVMTRRGEARCEVALSIDTTSDLAVSKGRTLFILVLDGQYRLWLPKLGCVALQAGEGLCLDQPVPGLKLRAATAGGRMLCSEITCL